MIYHALYRKDRLWSRFIYLYTYIYIYFLFLRVVIWETLRACYFHSTSLSLTWFLLFTKALRFKRWKLGSPMTFALTVSSLRLSVCFICDKRAWVIYCSLSWQLYIFETSNLSFNLGTRMCFIHICRSMLVVIIPGALLVRDKTCRRK